MSGAYLISAGADDALKRYLAARHDVDASRIKLESLYAQPKASSDITGTLWEAQADFVYRVDGEQHVLEIGEGDAAEFLDQLAEHVDVSWHGSDWRLA